MDSVEEAVASMPRPRVVMVEDIPLAQQALAAQAAAVAAARLQWLLVLEVADAMGMFILQYGERMIYISLAQ
jgi:hypothetical protein